MFSRNSKIFQTQKLKSYLFHNPFIGDLPVQNVRKQKPKKRKNPSKEEGPVTKKVKPVGVAKTAKATTKVWKFY